MRGSWSIVVVAGLMEIVWAISMHFSNGFTDLKYTCIVAVFLCMSMYLLSLALRRGIPVGTAYAMWIGIGAVGTLIVSTLIGIESIVVIQALFIMMIVLGVIGLQMSESKRDE